jgi:ABC-type branched-subunit amino acid transport system substrate-binding protein
MTLVAVLALAAGVAACGDDDDNGGASATTAAATTAASAETSTAPTTAATTETSAAPTTAASTEASTAPTTAATTETSAAPPTGEPIVLYSSIPMSGGSDLTSLRVGGEVAASAVNAAGGVQGRPLKFVACDMKLTPAGSEECGRAAIDDGAVAMVMSQDAFGGAITLTSAKGIPSFGNCVCTAEDAVNELSYPTIQGPVSQAAQGIIAGALGAKTVSAALFDGAAGDTIGANVAMGLALYGLKLDIPVKIPQNAGDLSPYIAQLAEADAVVVITNPNTSINVIRSLAEMGYDGQVISSASLVTPDDLGRLGDAAEGLYIAAGSIPSTSAGAPGVDEFNAEFDEYGDDSTPRGGYAVEAWAAIHLIANVMQDMDTIDSASLITAMTSAGTLQVQPAVPVDFSAPVEAFAPVRSFTSKFYIDQVKDGVFVPLQEEPFDFSAPPKTLPAS